MKKLIPLIFATIILMQVTPAGAQHCNVQREGIPRFISRIIKIKQALSTKNPRRN